MRVITVKIPDDLLIKLDTYAMNHRLSRSDVVREALEFYLKHSDGRRALLYEGRLEKLKKTGEFKGVRA